MLLSCTLLYAARRSSVIFPLCRACCILRGCSNQHCTRCRAACNRAEHSAVSSSTSLGHLGSLCFHATLATHATYTAHYDHLRRHQSVLRCGPRRCDAQLKSVPRVTLRSRHGDDQQEDHSTAKGIRHTTAQSVHACTRIQQHAAYCGSGHSSYSRFILQRQC